MGCGGRRKRMEKNNNFSPSQSLITSDFSTKIEKSFETIYQVIDNLQNQNWEKICDTLSNFSEKVKTSAQVWASYGWVPNLPEYNLIDSLKTINAPISQREADDIMMSKIDDRVLFSLFDKIADYNTQAGLNSNSFEEAVKCFDNKLYSACSLLLFAMIDARFLIGQPKVSKENRNLARPAVSKAIDEKKSKYAVIAFASKTIIEQLFLKANDYDYSIEKGLNRNFISHGMNKYNPDNTDCIKLFILLYNIDLLFHANYFRWNNS